MSRPRGHVTLGTDPVKRYPPDAPQPVVERKRPHHHRARPVAVLNHLIGEAVKSLPHPIDQSEGATR